MTESSQRADRSQQEAMTARIESLERRVTDLEVPTEKGARVGRGARALVVRCGG